MATLTLAICARNAKDCIGSCLKSVQGQTVPPDKIVVAVDDENDPTLSVAREFDVTIIVSNGTGLYEARNAVLNACTTDYLAFTDADCVLVEDWVRCAKNALDARPDVAAGTGPHPPSEPRNLAGWLHHMWFLVETIGTGRYTDGVIGGNSYFRTAALKEVGGWLNLPGHSAAEDVYISKALLKKGHRIWFDEGAIVGHQYETRLGGLWKKSVMMGQDIVVMMRAASYFDSLWWYTLAIPIAPLLLVVAAAAAPIFPALAALLAGIPLAATMLFLTVRFRSVGKAFPRWIARWVVIWPYSWGVLKGLAAPLPTKREQGGDNGAKS